jgi:hypothetical protein
LPARPLRDLGLHAGHVRLRRLGDEAACGHVGPALGQRRLELAFAQVLVLSQMHHHIPIGAAHRHHRFGAAAGKLSLDGGDTAGLQVVGSDVRHGGFRVL